MAFLTRLAEKAGLLDFLAPPEEERNSNSQTSRRLKKQQQQKQNSESNDEKLARKLQAEEETRFRRLSAQFKAEEKAEACNQFAKKQRVHYYHKASDSYHDAFVVGVHFDDGPEKPYYTIKYKKQTVGTNTDGTETETAIEVEKQTDPDRLSRLEWDEDKTWEILK